MKRLIYFVAVICALVSCSSKAGSAKDESTGSGQTTVIAEDAPATTSESMHGSMPPKAAAKAANPVVEYTGGAITDYANGRRYIIIDFNAEWCGPCRNFAPIFHEVAADECDKAAFVSVNIDEYPELAMEYRVTSIPTIIALRPDGSYAQKIGLMTEDQFEDFVESIVD